MLIFPGGELSKNNKKIVGIKLADIKLLEKGF